MARGLHRDRAKRAVALQLFLVLTLGGGILIGLLNPPGAWYAGLQKGPLSPPSWLFPPAWTLLYILIAIAGWRVWDLDLGRPIWRWFGQIGLNFAWSPVFFGHHLVGGGLAVLLLLLAAILAFIAETWNRDRTAAVLFLPYAAWVAYAGLLNGSIWWLN